MLNTTREIDEAKFDDLVLGLEGQYLHGQEIATFQVNVGLRCNQSCRHCHLECSPARTEKETSRAPPSVSTVRE